MDNGEGIQNKRIVFKPFYSTKLGGSNLGLGLSFAKKIITYAGGNIDIISIPKKHTKVQIALPIEKKRKERTNNAKN